MNYALLAVSSVASKIAPFGVHLSLYFGRGMGSTYEASPLPPPKPPPTPLHVQGGDIALLTQSVASF